MGVIRVQMLTMFTCSVSKCHFFVKGVFMAVDNVL